MGFHSCIYKLTKANIMILNQPLTLGLPYISQRNSHKVPFYYIKNYKININLNYIISFLIFYLTEKYLNLCVVNYILNLHSIMTTFN